MRPFEVERGIQAFRDYASEDLVRDVRRKVFRDLDYELQRRIRPPVPNGAVATPLQLAEYVHQCRRIVEALISEHVSGYAAARWLYYCRRIPNIAFLSYQGGLDLYKVGVAEAMTGHISTSQIDEGPNYPLHQPVLQRVLRFSQEIVYLVNLHVALHQAAKGVPFKFGNSALPVAQLDSSTSEALSLFDWRVASFDQRPLARLGTQACDKASIDSVEKVFASVPRIKETEWVRSPESPNDSRETPKILANYRIMLLDLEELGRLITDYRIVAPVWSTEAGALLMVLRMAAEMFSEPRFFRPVLEMGYVPTARATLLELFSNFFESAERAVRNTIPELPIPNSPERLLRELEGMRGSSWPIRTGPVVRCSGEAAELDLNCATMRLDQAFEFPRVTGAQANARAEHFERTVQSAVDSSPWFNSAARRMQGRTLRHAGKYITDVDAIGAIGGKLVLISCKSVLYAEYETADYRVMRNAADLVQKAVATWSQVCSFLRDNRIGENYDFSSYSEIIGVVCTPILVYTPLGIATISVAKGLYAAVSISELDAWLHGQSLERR
jgi:hypothetical protein